VSNHARYHEAQFVCHEAEANLTMPRSTPRTRLNPARAWWTILLFLCGGLIIAAISLEVSSRVPRTPGTSRTVQTRMGRLGYVGSQSCAACHPAEYASHSQSGHARTLHRTSQTSLAKRLNGTSHPDPEQVDTSWSYLLRNGQLWIERRGTVDVERFPIDYAFGSGNHATTFVTLIDRSTDRPTSLEHRLTVFSHKEALDITPGQARVPGVDSPGVGPSGHRYSSSGTLKCFECHTTATSDRGPLVLDEATMVPNIGCERCHGPARMHVQAAQRHAGDAELAMPFGPGRWSNAEQIRLCGSCHRLPEMGDPALIRQDNPFLVRFQPVGLMQSACYRKSQGALSCTICHDPHTKTSTDLAAYESVCLGCHRGPAKTLCKISPSTGCVACHMPHRDVSRGMMMADHWIRSRP
jgi:predicted CXXCH cytochrome family protein